MVRQKRFDAYMNVQIRYVTRRPNKTGADRWYWQRRGFPLTRLPDDLARRLQKAEQLNQHADQTAADVSGTIAALIHTYMTTDRFEDLSPKSKKAYRQWCAYFDELWGDLFVADISRRVVIDFGAKLGRLGSYKTCGHRGAHHNL